MTEFTFTSHAMAYCQNSHFYEEAAVFWKPQKSLEVVYYKYFTEHTGERTVYKVQLDVCVKLSSCVMLFCIVTPSSSLKKECDQ